VKTAYVDTSALVAIQFGERSGRATQARLAAQDELVSSSLLVAEFLAAARREGLPLDIAGARLADISLLHPRGSLRAECEEVLSHEALRGADVWHLATALALAGKAPRRSLLFVSLDVPQREVARKLGFRTWPA
jgi:predicted nucleic acid-binding protein